MDWKFTLRNIFENKITNKTTNPAQMSKNKFRLKTFINKLPTLNEIKLIYPEVYESATCSDCGFDTETNTHIFSCPK